jgi:hypothetical protein
MSIELRNVADEHPSASHGEEAEAGLIQSLPPTDKGSEAWKFLFASFIIEALLWGT